MRNWLLIIFTLLLGVLVYQQSFKAEFVYDDNRQIEANQLIQNPKFYKQALLTDVWSFKADGKTSVSNYWRPTFVAWMIVNYQVAALDPFYWHVINVLIHFLVVVLIFVLLHSWSVGVGMALSISAIFALHPVHVESVAWVAGSPDLLLSLFIIAALICWQYFVRANKRLLVHWLLLVFSLLFYALALGAKEVAIVFPPLFILMAYWKGEASLNEDQLVKKSPDMKLMSLSMLFILLAVAYFIVRLNILGYVSKPDSLSLSLNQYIYSLPHVLSFYGLHLLFPWEAAANFPPRAMNEITLIGFVMPLIFIVIMFVLALILGKKSRFQALGLLMMCLPLLPALNLFAFHHEQFVHHRYLYFSVLGLLMLLVPFWQNFIGRKYPSASYIVLALLLLGYSYQSWRFGQIWQSNLSLWEHTTKVDPESAFNWQQLANVKLEAEQFPAAKVAFERSIGIKATARSLYGLAKTHHSSGANGDAITILEKTIRQHQSGIDQYLAYQIYELYAVILTEINQLQAAESHLKRAFKQLPQYQALLADKLAVVLYLQNKKAAALELLISVEQAALDASHAAAKLVFFRLGMLYDESGQYKLAKNAFSTYLRESRFDAKETHIQYKTIAADYLKKH